jgi:hypothetical protein
LVYPGRVGRVVVASSTVRVVPDPSQGERHEGEPNVSPGGRTEVFYVRFADTGRERRDRHGVQQIDEVEVDAVRRVVRRHVVLDSMGGVLLVRS